LRSLRVNEFNDIGLKGFLERYKELPIEKRGDLESCRQTECNGKKWRAFGVFCGFYRLKGLGCEF
jgi:hypothetical protein